MSLAAGGAPVATGSPRLLAAGAAIPRPAGAKIRVCHVAMADAWAGAEVQLVALLRALARHPDLDMSAVLLHDGRAAGAVRELGIPTLVIPESRHSAWSTWRQLSRHLRQHPVDVLHTHKYRDNILAALASLIPPVPRRVRTIHGGAEPFTGAAALRMLLYRSVDAVVNRWLVDRVHAVSADLAQQLSMGVGRGKVIRIPNAVDVAAVHPARPPAELRRALGLDERQTLIGAMGRLMPVKGFETFIRAAGLIRQERPDVTFLLAGDGPLREELRRLARAVGLERDLRFLGHRDDSHDVLAMLDVFVLPSRHEGIPMVLLEALALARPVVATRVGGVPEVVTHGESGLLVAPDDPGALARACLEVIGAPALAARLAAGGLRHVAGRFSTAVVAGQFADLYRTLMEP